MSIPPVPTVLYLILSGMLFTIGVIGALTRRNAIVVFICIEMMLNAVNLTFITKEYPGCTENWTCDTCSRPVIPGAIANFTQNTTEGLTPLAVQFTDTSTGSPTFWNWSFGDGTYSDIQDVTKTYSTGGYYEINLTVWNANTTRSSKLGYVDVWNRTSNTFIANPGSSKDISGRSAGWMVRGLVPV